MPSSAVPGGGRPDRPGEDHREAGRPGRPLAPDDPAPRAVPRGAPPAVEATMPPTASAVSAPPVVTGVPYRDDTVRRAVAVPAGARPPAVPAVGPGEGGRTRWWAFAPTGVSGEESAAGTIHRSEGHLDGYGRDPERRTHAEPAAGVREPAVEARRTSPPRANPYAPTASVS
ncbi:hypothetical protein [Streptomyces filamentosus]|uniref:hypothetical protein n=1 Tax=Streptomyces filamentosus TaxID=67294 RepID=UPI0037D47D33